FPNRLKEKINIVPSGDKYFCEVNPELIAEAGLYEIELVAKNSDGALIGNANRQFVVIDRDKEKSNPAANPEQLNRLAAQTAEFGGKAIVPQDLGPLLDDYINNPPMTKIEIPMKWQLGGTFWDAAGFLMGFVTLLSIEWVLRKKWGLV
ncbi:MAG: hypothetical protein AAF939_15615, partial [Planctomycetota bacterium]